MDETKKPPIPVITHSEKAHSGFKMAMAIILQTVLAVSGTLCQFSTAEDVRVSISTPTNTVTVGGILAIRCQIWNLESHLTVNIARVSSQGRTDRITEGKYILRPSERLNMFLSTRTFSDRSTVFFLTVVDVSEVDNGEYQCKVADFNEFYNVIGENAINIEIYSLPSNVYPICASTPNAPTFLRTHGVLKLKCTSEKGEPIVSIDWFNSKSNRQLSSKYIYEDALIHSEAIIQIDDSLHNALFICEITSEPFPDWKRRCVVGPITIQSYTPNVIQNHQTAKTDIQGPLHTGNPHFTGNCGDCSPSNNTLEFYLTVATVGTGLLTILFIVTTIIMCHKYHSISEQTRRQPTRVLTSQQSVEPVYVSLQRRPQSTYSEREYMTLEDPNNPDNKIILPKETFDDYCRTMTLKRV